MLGKTNVLYYKDWCLLTLLNTEAIKILTTWILLKIESNQN